MRYIKTYETSVARVPLYNIFQVKKHRNRRLTPGLVIKTHDGWNSFKFKENDILIAYDNEKRFYQVLDAMPGFDNENRYELLEILRINPIKVGARSFWIEEKDLRKISIEELELLFTASKYNL